MRLFVQDHTGRIAEIDGFEGPVPRAGEFVYVPVGTEPFSEPRLVKEVYHDFLAARTRPPRAGERRFRLARRPTVVIQV
jgi:hypothetical protein